MVQSWQCVESDRSTDEIETGKEVRKKESSKKSGKEDGKENRKKSSEEICKEGREEICQKNGKEKDCKADEEEGCKEEEVIYSSEFPITLDSCNVLLTGKLFLLVRC